MISIIPPWWSSKQLSAKISSRILSTFIKADGFCHVFANYEYEVDVLSRDVKVQDHVGQDAHLSLHHDQCVVEPGNIKTGSGGPMNVFSP